MSTEELQQKLIAKISNTTEPYILEEVLRLLAFEEDASIYNINNTQKDLINKSLQEIKNGHFLTDEEVKKETEEWLKK